MNFESGRVVHEDLAKYSDLENQVLCKWTYLGHAHMQLNNEKDSQEMEACGRDDDLLEEIVLGDLVDGHHAKIRCRVAFPSHLTSTAAKELGLVAGIPVETSLIDAHMGGVGLLESVPITDSEPKECYVTKLTGHGVVDTIRQAWNIKKEMYGVHFDFIPFWNATLMDKGKKKKSPEEAQKVVGNMNDAAAGAKQIKEMEQVLTRLIVLGNGLFSDLIAQVQDIIESVNEADILPEKFDSVIIRAEIQKLAREIREVTSSRPVTIYNENSFSSGNHASYLVPVAALAAMGYCYMWNNMENVIEALIREAEWLNGVTKITKLSSFMIQMDKSVEALNKGKNKKTGDGGYSDEMKSLHDLSVSKAVDMVTGFESALAEHVVNNLIRSTTISLERLHSEGPYRLPEW
ncbi:hypothetical protein TB1_033719 [Malus domestica]